MIRVANSDVKLRSLELGRGLAAILVLLYHIDRYYFSTPKYYESSLLNGLFKFGHSGVEYFFVLSGFIMIWSYRNEFGDGLSAGRFVKKRIIRIYPLLIFCTLALLILYVVSPQAGEVSRRTPFVIMESVALVGRNPLNSIDFPSWTLWHENIFYVFCAAIIWKPRVGLLLTFVWGICCIVGGLFGDNVETTFYPFNMINLLFLLGAGAAICLDKFNIPMPGTVLLLGLVCFSLFGLYVDQHQIDGRVQHVVFGLSAFLMIVGAVELERAGRLRLGNWAGTMGSLSYPLYLTHMITLPIVAKFASKVHLIGLLPPAFGLAFFFGLAVVVALMTHRLVEKPLTRSLRGWWLTEPPVRSAREHAEAVVQA